MHTHACFASLSAEAGYCGLRSQQRWSANERQRHPAIDTVENAAKGRARKYIALSLRRPAIERVGERTCFVLAGDEELLSAVHFFQALFWAVAKQGKAQ